MPFLHIILLNKDSAEQQIHFNGNIFGTNAIVAMKGHYNTKPHHVARNQLGTLIHLPGF